MGVTPGEPLIECQGLSRHYPIRSGLFGRETGRVRAVDDLTLHVRRGETYSLVGESGCGKSTTGRLFLRLELPTAGRVLLRGVDITSMRGTALRRFRRLAQPVFQDPFSSLNPRMTVGATVEEGLVIHEPDLSRAGRRDRAADLLALTGLDAGCLDRWPHEFSGGQRQRVGLARALSTRPEFIVADEAVSALDVSVQAQIINLLRDLQERLGLAYLFIAHDLAVVKHLSHRVGVMYLGHLMEEGGADALFSDPLHPYTRALLSAIPNPDPGAGRGRIILSGDVPRADRPPSGCRFRTRCPSAMPRCGEAEVQLLAQADGRKVRCLLYGQGAPSPARAGKGSPPGLSVPGMPGESAPARDASEKTV
ncbi:MAG: ATP-binding cassette domain-containing protein [Planctomycetota bacterium]|jgi:oligopeptide/dipeptide ABC transporter ATP-binding protein|nr:ATP-binding cassette domain-containing protein [Planctomycetota bacterium]